MLGDTVDGRADDAYERLARIKRIVGAGQVHVWVSRAFHRLHVGVTAAPLPISSSWSDHIERRISARCLG
jgi:hypothetical protein